jgi:hypothetical protein
MTLNSILATAGITVPLVMAGLYWLLRAFISHRLGTAMEAEKAGFARQLESHKSALADDLEAKKAALQADLAREKAAIEGQIRRAVELELGDKSAERTYALEARRRLYVAIGPLRFQLLLACRDYASRLVAHGRGERYELDLARYYGQSTLYRLLRPLAIAELIERQVAYSDFSVDAGAVDCLRFKKTLVRLLSGADVVLGHPKLDWSRQSEHVYADAAVVGASGLICEDGGAERVRRFDEFAELLAAEGAARFEPFAGLVHGFRLADKPILWLRLVACAHACSAFVARDGGALGFEPHAVPVGELLAASGDRHIKRHLAAYVQAVEDNALVAL